MLPTIGPITCFKLIVNAFWKVVLIPVSYIVAYSISGGYITARGVL